MRRAREASLLGEIDPFKVRNLKNAGSASPNAAATPLMDRDILANPAADNKRLPQTAGNIFLRASGTYFALTAHALEGDRDKILAAGMDDHLLHSEAFESLRATERQGAAGVVRKNVCRCRRENGVNRSRAD